MAILFPAPPDRAPPIRVEETRLARIADALDRAGLAVEGTPYADEIADRVRTQLLGVDGVLVWVNPVEGDRDRSVLNAMLEDVASAGVFVSAHPQAIRRMGTKEVLFRTRSMGWGCDTRLYTTPQAMHAELPGILSAGSPRVLKQIRGNGGNGVWKVEPVAPGRRVPTLDEPMRVRHAKRGSVEEIMPLDRFLRSCEPYFAGGGGMIDQPYQPRLTDGMVRCYMVRDRVAGFGEQLINALFPAAPGADPSTAPEPGPRLYYPPTRPDFQPIRRRMEHEWVAEMCRTLELDPAQLPIIWDADFLYGPKDADGNDSYVLCEINVSSVYPFPDEALGPLAAATRAVLDARQ